METQSQELKNILEETFNRLAEARAAHEARLSAQEVGTVTYVGSGIVRVSGLRNVRAKELI
jgi:F0F1-type ATP synthase alpha subunit